MTKSKREFLIENKLTKEVETSHEEYQKLRETAPEKIVTFIDCTGRYDENNQYKIESDKYTIIDDSLSHDEIIEEALFSINKKAKITMYCALFFVVLTLISMITTFVFTYKISKVTDVFDEIYSYDSSDDYDYDYWD